MKANSENNASLTVYECICMPRSLQRDCLKRIPLLKRFLKSFFSCQNSTSTLAQPLKKKPLCSQSALTQIHPNLCRMETRYKIENVKSAKHVSAVLSQALSLTSKDSKGRHLFPYTYYGGVPGHEQVEYKYNNRCQHCISNSASLSGEFQICKYVCPV